MGANEKHMAVRMFQDRHPQFDTIPVVLVSTPDLTSAMEAGCALAIAAVIEQLVLRVSDVGTRLGRHPRQVNVLAGTHLTPGDLEHLKDLIALYPIVLPDLSDFLDGHLTEQDLSPLTVGGT